MHVNNQASEDLQEHYLSYKKWDLGGQNQKSWIFKRDFHEKIFYNYFRMVCVLKN